MTEVKRYQLRQPPLAESQYARLWLAFDPELERDVVVKLLPHASAEARREGQIMAQMRNVPIVPIYDQGQIGDSLFIVMAHMPEPTLAQRLQQSVTISPYQLLPIANRIVAALDELHQHGIYHCDIKPANILFQNNQAYVSDFGIARLRTDQATDTIEGTPPFMAPEQWRGNPVSAQTDIYQCGVLFFRALTGHYPFSADSSGSYRDAHLCTPIPSIAPYLDTYPLMVPALDYFFASALAKQPSNRFGTVVEMQTAWAKTLDTGAASQQIPIPESAQAMPTNGRITPVMQAMRLEYWIVTVATIYLASWMLAGFILTAGSSISWIGLMLTAIVTGVVSGVSSSVMFRTILARQRQPLKVQLAQQLLLSWGSVTIIALPSSIALLGIGTVGQWVFGIVLPLVPAAYYLAQQSTFGRIQLIGGWLLINSVTMLPLMLFG